ncbi:MAG: gamma-glutamyl-gamma-aminobutyrate hydrolase family protein [Erysipelotrichaceae bacterium]|nr:gamma-glutamyl-gamma-aminobutyrate hydrolase family protein [Erysipelotrichaceae bacterium]
MKIAIVQRYKVDEDGDGIYYVTEDNRKMFENNGVELFVIDDVVKAEEAVKVCNGLCVPGGIDVNPARYSEEMNGTKYFNDWLDDLDYAAIEAFHKAGKPILGICRGHQVINVFFGGSLHQDINGHWGNRHDVVIDKDSFVRKIYDKDRLQVNSYHHQSVKDVAPGFKVIAKADDGTIEAMQYKNIYTVQWHPEMYDPDVFIRYFIEDIFC